MKEVKDFFPMIEFETAQEALLQVFSFLLYEGKSKNYGIYYIWSKNDKFYIEALGKYHSVDLWRNQGYDTYDIVELKNYKRRYFNDTKEEVLTGFMFHGSKFFDEDVCFMNKRNTIDY